MSTRKRRVMVAMVTACLCVTGVQAQVFEPNLPDDFPELVVTQQGPTAPGVFIGWLGWWVVDYYVVLDQSGFPLFYSKTDAISYPDVMSNGLISAPAPRGYTLKDETFTIVDSFQMSEGYGVNIHDFKVLPNGHALIIGTYRRNVDMSQIVPGGRPDAQLTCDVVQEIDGNKQVLFEWHALDHIPVTDSFHDLTQKNIDYAHFNSINLDPTDNNLLLSLRTTSDIVKVSRSTGEVLWRFGGKDNDFTFIGEHEENAPYYFVGQHAIWRFRNGNLLFFDNGNISGGGLTPCDRTYSRGVEYHLDEVNRTATLVWEFRHDPDIKSPSGGRAQPLANGNILLDWGSAIPTGTPEVPLVTEVSPAGELVYELHYASATKGARLQKYVWNSPDLVRSQAHLGIKAGSIYESKETGVTITVGSLEGPAGNGLVAKRHTDAARLVRFAGKSPQALAERVTLSGFGIDAIAMDVAFDVQGLDFDDPAQLTVYHRPCPGQGVFTARATSYDPVAQQLTVTDAPFGEFIFTYPDAPEIPLPPILHTPDDLAIVNQTQPVALEWTPMGFGRSYHVQVATDAEFTTLVADESGLTEPRHTLSTPMPDATYHWRVRTTNAGGTGDWSARSFRAVGPMIQVTSPHGGESWKRGLSYFIQWQDNIPENIEIELFKGESPVRTIAKPPSLGAYAWEVGLDLEPGDDYTIRIKSTTDGTTWDQSDATFSIE
ncbi:MAG: aryl-sulfate sulfotransferase [Sedimentisphaerales bacterium]|nr:aryl-sulfate sulfotransferase [Sedimentisphaerales bacterium]